MGIGLTGLGFRVRSFHGMAPSLRDSMFRLLGLGVKGFVQSLCKKRGYGLLWGLGALGNDASVYFVWLSGAFPRSRPKPISTNIPILHAVSIVGPLLTKF